MKSQFTWDQIEADLLVLLADLQEVQRQFANRESEAKATFKALDRVAVSLYHIVYNIFDYLYSTATTQLDCIREETKKFYQDRLSLIEEDISQAKAEVSYWQELSQTMNTPLAAAAATRMARHETAILNDLLSKQSSLRNLAENPDPSDWISLAGAQAMVEYLAEARRLIGLSPPIEGELTADAAAWHHFATVSWPKIKFGSKPAALLVAPLLPHVSAFIAAFGTIAGFLDAFREKIDVAPANILEDQYREKIVKTLKLLIHNVRAALKEAQ
jgi:hypothetical protein